VNHLIINWGQLCSVKGGIQRDSEIFLEELNRTHSVKTTETSSKYFYIRNLHRLVNGASVFGFATPIDLFKKKNFAEFQLSGFRVRRRNSSHIVRLHDLFPITNPEWFRLRTRIMFRRALKAAVKSHNTTFVCNSNFTLNTLESLFPVRTFNSYVLPCSSKLNAILSCRQCQGCLDRNQNIDKFVIMVGTIEPRKNYKLLLSALDEIDLKVVIVGRYGWRQRRTRDKIKDLEKTGKIVWLDECCDGALQELYKKASLFLSTSIEEGFNLSAMEAKIFGLELVLSDNAGHRENYSYAASFFTTKDEMVSLIKGIQT
jgi:glycosyltransferase involved in cell wall biosynthesis